MNSYNTNPDGTTVNSHLPTDGNISMNLTKGKDCNKHNEHVAEVISSREELLAVAKRCGELGLPVMDKSEHNVYPKYMVVPKVDKLREGDLIRIYTTTRYNIGKSCLDWTPEEQEQMYKISESDLDQLLMDLGDFVNRDAVRERFTKC